MKKGDKVRFLYTKGGGLVKGFQGKDIVLVEDETGFEIPIMINECVVVSDNPQIKSTTPSIKNFQERVKEELEIPYQYEETPEGDQISAHLVFLSNDIKNISSSAFETYLVNESNYFLNYTYLSKENNSWILRVSGTVEPNTQIFLEEFQNTQANELENICLQCIAYKKDKPFELKQAVSKIIRFDVTKLFKVHCFRENPFFDEKGIVLSLMINDENMEPRVIIAKDIEESLRSKRSVDAPNVKPTLSKEKSQKVLEVDLHIDELLDSTLGLSNADILQVQLDTFNQTLKEYANQKGQKIVFIHGKGEGVLRNAIIDELKRKYRGYIYQDASFKEYGFGATMVTIK